MTIVQNSVTYSAELINELLQEHRHIFSLLEKIKSALIHHEYPQAEKLLTELRSTVIMHVSKENLKLYVYLQDHYRNSVQEYQKLRKIRKYANSAEAQLMTFLDQNKDIATDTQKQEGILNVFEQLYATLTKKKLTEEKEAYPMYKPPAFHWNP